MEATHSDLPTLEERIQRLEDAVAALQETRPAPARPAHMENHDKPAGFAAVAGLPEANGPGHADPAATRTIDPEPVAAPRAPWLIFDLYAEIKATVRMFRDRRFRVAWSTFFLVVGLVIGILTSSIWFPLAYVPLLGGYLDKALDLLLAFVAVRVLSREVRRYGDFEKRHW
jgi:hypothetical protein